MFHLYSTLHHNDKYNAFRKAQFFVIFVSANKVTPLSQSVKK